MLTKKLSKEQEEVLYLLTKEFLTTKQVALRRKTTLQATYKTINKIKQKGYLKSIPKGVENYQPTFKPPTNQIRLHGQELNIKLLFKDEKYKLLLNKTNLLYIDGNPIRLYTNSIEVYITKSFYADNANKATSKSMQYITRLLNKVENDLKVIIVKPRHQNIKLVNQHYAEINNELAEEMEKKGQKIRVYTNDDGKLWFTIDNSFNFHEAETQHPKTAKQDMQDTVQPFFNDLRDNKPPKLSEMYDLLTKQANIMQGIQENQTIFDKNMKSHIKVVQEMGKAFNKFNKLLKTKQNKLSDYI